MREKEVNQEQIVLQFGAFLHDVGKFQQRGMKKIKAHAVLGEEFVKNLGLGEKIGRMVASHHRPSSCCEMRKLAEIVQEADQLSASEREEKEDQEEVDVSEEPLRTVFSYVVGKKKEYEPKKNERFYRISRLKIGELGIGEKEFEAEKRLLYPKKEKKDAFAQKSGRECYSEMWQEMTSELRKIKSERSEAFFTTLFHILMKYTSQIPSAAYYSVPDITLFDHLRCTAAIAENLYMGDGENLLLVGGDLSGIQDFLYSVRAREEEESQAGAARRLRGRSFLLNILTESVADYLLEEIGISVASKLWCSGGHFYILAYPSSKEKLNECKEKINDYLFKEWEGELFFAISWVEFKKEKIHTEFPSLVHRLNSKLDIEKKRKFIDVLDADSILFKKKGEPCKGCGRKKEGTEPFCAACKNQEEIGRNLPKAEYLVELRGYCPSKEKGDVSFKDLNIHWFICEDEKVLFDKLEFINKECEGKVTLFRLNSTDFLKDEILEHGNKLQIPLSFGFKFLGNAAPFKEKEKRKSVKPFEELGWRIGVLRMDVDDLGAILSIGLQSASRDEDSEKNKYTISRFTSFSRLLDLFFLAHLNSIAKKHELYITYSGGDDVFLVGDWKKIIDASLSIKENFTEFTAENPNITISAGVFITRPRFPIGRASKIAGHYLDDYSKKAKGVEEKGMPKKDKITVFNQTLYWKAKAAGEEVYVYNGLKELLEKANWLNDLVKEKKMSMGFVYSLLKWRNMSFGKGWRKGEEPYLDTFVSAEEALKRKRYIPQFKYMLVRHFEPKDELFKRLNKEIPKIVPWARIPVAWVSYNQREKREVKRNESAKEKE